MTDSENRCAQCGGERAAWTLRIHGVSVCTHYCAKIAGLLGDQQGEIVPRTLPPEGRTSAPHGGARAP